MNGTTAQLLPRILRLKDAQRYLGIGKNTFNQQFRPALTEIRIGKTGVRFDRYEIDELIEQRMNKKNSHDQINNGEKSWQKNASPALSNAVKFGISTKSSMDEEYDAVVKQIRSKKRR